MPRSLYAYILQMTARRQVPLCLLTVVVVLLSMAPLELQRRIMDNALETRDIHLLVILGGIYLVLMLVQGGLKYVLNVSRGRLVEFVTLRLREQIYASIATARAVLLPPGDDQRLESGSVVSMVAAEAEGIGGFVGESLSIPLLQGGTVIAVTGYLLWLDPLIASFAVVIYIPQALVVPRIQVVINRFARIYARQVRKLGNQVVARMAAAGNGDDGSEHFGRLAKQAYDTQIRIYYIKFFLTALGNFLDALGPLVILLVGGWYVIQHDTDVSTIVVFISGFQKIADPWDQLINFYRSAAIAQTKYGLIRDSLL